MDFKELGFPYYTLVNSEIKRVTGSFPNSAALRKHPRYEEYVLWIEEQYASIYEECLGEITKRIEALKERIEA
jgi:hypothetical protein